MKILMEVAVRKLWLACDKLWTKGGVKTQWTSASAHVLLALQRWSRD